MKRIVSQKRFFFFFLFFLFLAGIESASIFAQYSISGNVFIDANRSKQISGQSNYAGSITITATDSGGHPVGTVTYPSAGKYLIAGLSAGTYTVSYTTLPSGYQMSIPVNGPPPSWNVAVGVGNIGGSCPIAGDTDPHLTCVSSSCTSVSGCGPNTCTTVGAACSASQSHAACVSGACVMVSGGGSDTCAQDSDCTTCAIKGNTNPHFTCSGNSCTSVPGCGANTCSAANSSCVLSQYHTACNGNTCAYVLGSGTNSCASVADCGGGNGCSAINGQTNPHLGCVNNTCTLVSSCGGDECSTAGSSCTGNTYNACINNACTVIYGSGTSNCTGASGECSGCPVPGETNPHFVCVSNTCASVNFCGPNDCAVANSSCTRSTYTACIGGACTIIFGSGTNSCTTNADCGTYTQATYYTQAAYSGYAEATYAGQSGYYIEAAYAGYSQAAYYSQGTYYSEGAYGTGYTESTYGGGTYLEGAYGPLIQGYGYVQHL